MKKIGVWIDKREAKIVTLAAENETLHTVPSNVEDYHVKGGSGTRLKGGPQDVVQDRKYLEREKHQLRVFFRNVVAEIDDADELLIFGPAQVPQKLEKELVEIYPQLSEKVRGVEKADSMTENQVKAWVRDFFAN